MKCFGLPWGALAVSCAVFMSGCGDERDSAATAPPLRAALGSGQFAIQIDATILSASELNLSGIGAISTGSVQSVTLDPGSYSVSYGEPLTGAAVIFSVTAAGTVDFDASLNGILTGRGTT